jgi:hypothetical protein
MKSLLRNIFKLKYYEDRVKNKSQLIGGCEGVVATGQIKKFSEKSCRLNNLGNGHTS